MIADAIHRLSYRAQRQFDRARRHLRRERDDRQTLKDRALARRFRDTFEQELEVADVQGLHFYARNGVVTIYGTVRHELDRELLLSFIRQMPGVKDVVPHLETLEEPTDETA